MKRLYRSESNKKVAGICGGIAEHFDLDPVLVRVLAVFLGLITGVFPLLTAYVIAWWIIPSRSQISTP